MYTVYFFCLLAVHFVAYCQESEEMFKVPKCPICYASDYDSCPEIRSTSTCEPVMEPNCGCCMMCARREGERCGVGKGYCESESTCLPSRRVRNKFGSFLEALTMGKLVCISREYFRKTDPELYSVLELNPEETEVIDEVLVIPPRITPPKGLSRERASRPPKAPVFLFHRLNPCEDHYNFVMNKEYFDRHDWVPECNMDSGLYRPLQCEMSHGLVEGRCWCVNERGKALTRFLPGGMERAVPSNCPNYQPELNL